MNSLHFIRPEWFWALLPLAILLAYLIKFARREMPWSGLVDAHLLSHLLVGKHKGRPFIPLIALGLAWGFGIVALAGPSWTEKTVPRFRPDAPPLIVLLDLSKSMEVEDVSPNRIAVARREIRALVGQMPPCPMALIAVAGTAHGVTPVTGDRQILTAMLEPLTPAIMPVPGSRVEAGLRKAAEMVGAGHWKRADLLVVADDAGEEAIATAKELRAQGIRTSVLAVGGSEGMLFERGEQIALPMNRKGLEALARAGGGVLILARADGRDTVALVENLQNKAAGFAKEKDDGERVWRDDGGWLVLLLLPLAALAFRRGWLAVVLLILALSPEPAFALEWRDLWKTPDQQGYDALQHGDGASASRLFNDPFWKGVARYRVGDLEGALDIFQTLPSAKAQYNRGNILVRQGRLHEALEAYDRALKLEPAFADALFNKSLVSEVLDQSVEPSDDKPDRPGKAPPEEGKAKKGRKTAPGQAPQGGTEENDQKGQTKKLESPKVGGQGGGAANNDEKKDDKGEGVEGGSSAGGSVARKLDDGRRQKAPSGGLARQKPAKEKSPQQKVLERDEELPETAQGKKPGSNSMTAPPDMKGEGQKGAAGQGDPKDDGGASGRVGRVDETLKETDQEIEAAGLHAESRRALKQWLDRIPDNPEGLLREKFKREAETLTTVPRGGSPW